MTIGTVTVTANIGGSPSRPTYRATVQFAGDVSYPTGGFPTFRASMLGVTEDNITISDVQGKGYTNAAKTTISHFVRYDFTNDKLVVYVFATGVEVAGAVDILSTIFEVTYTGE